MRCFSREIPSHLLHTRDGQDSERQKYTSATCTHQCQFKTHTHTDTHTRTVTHTSCTNTHTHTHKFQFPPKVCVSACGGRVGRGIVCKASICVSVGVVKGVSLLSLSLLSQSLYSFSFSPPLLVVQTVAMVRSFCTYFLNLIVVVYALITEHFDCGCFLTHY